MRWEKKEVEKAARIFAAAERKKTVGLRLLDEAVHWIILLIILIGNALISGFVILAGGFVGKFLYALVLVLGLSFGWLIELPIRDLEKLDKHKHFLSRALMPLLAAINAMLFLGFKRMAEIALGYTLQFNAAIAGALYAVAFLVPHIIYHLRKKRAK